MKVVVLQAEREGMGGVFLGGEWVESIFNCTSPSTNLQI